MVQSAPTQVSLCCGPLTVQTYTLLGPDPFPPACKHVPGLKEQLPADQFLWQLNPSLHTGDTAQHHSGVTRATSTWLALVAPRLKRDGGLTSWPTPISM